MSCLLGVEVRGLSGERARRPMVQGRMTFRSDVGDEDAKIYYQIDKIKFSSGMSTGHYM